MVKLLLILSFGIGPGSLIAQNKDGIKSEFEQLYWLKGTWSQTNITKPGKALTEQWRKSGDYTLSGQATTTQNGDTVYIERIALLIKDDAVYYVADVPQNKQPVFFKLTSISDTAFVCENPAHDFPKKISYQLNGPELKATISGNGKSIDYLYKRID